LSSLNVDLEVLPSGCRFVVALDAFESVTLSDAKGPSAGEIQKSIPQGFSANIPRLIFALALKPLS
jgi:hypothetical protein